MTKVILEDVVDVDVYSATLGFTGWEVIMHLNCPDNIAKKAVLVIDTRT